MRFDFAKQPSILIQGAMTKETEWLLAHLQDTECIHLGNWVFHTGFLTDKRVPVIISKTYVGMVNASAATSLAMVCFNPKIVINQGVAGGHDPKLHRGDIAIADRVVNMGSWEYGFAQEGAGLDPFLCNLKDTSIYDRKTGQVIKMQYFFCDPQLVAVAESVECPMTKMTGTIGSADEWNNQLDRIAMLRERYQTIAEDMETAAAAQVCMSYRIPFIGIRILSNTILHREDYDPDRAIQGQRFILQYIEKLAEGPICGLTRGTVRLEPHSPIWDANAAVTIKKLMDILGSTAVDVQHIGSTSIQWIQAKPIIDMVIGVRTLESILEMNPELEKNGIIYRKQDHPGQLLYVIGEKETRTHHIHVVEYGSEAWCNYVNFRDYLNAKPEVAAEYDALKRSLSKKHAEDRGAYTSGKSQLIDRLLQEAREWAEQH